MKSIYEDNVKNYKAKYEKKGYGAMYPEGTVIRLFAHILEYDLPIGNDRAFDFGCGIGQHLKLFVDKGFIPFGCDVDKHSIDQSKKLLPEYKKNFYLTDPVPDLNDLIPDAECSFNLIITVSTLFHLNNKDMKNVINQFYSMMQKGGVFFATMLAPDDVFASKVVETDGEMSRVVLEGRLNESAWYNFMTKEQMIEMFKPFDKVHVGEEMASLREDEGSVHYWRYIGVKR